jgi:hypothetical protein
LGVDENSTPLLGHFLKLARELLLFRFAQRGAWDRHGDSPIESSPISEIRRALEFDPPKTLEHCVRGNCAVRPSGEVHTFFRRPHSSGAPLARHADLACYMRSTRQTRALVGFPTSNHPRSVSCPHCKKSVPS